MINSLNKNSYPSSIYIGILWAEPEKTHRSGRSDVFLLDCSYKGHQPANLTRTCQDYGPPSTVVILHTPFRCQSLWPFVKLENIQKSYQIPRFLCKTQVNISDLIWFKYVTACTSIPKLMHASSCSSQVLSTKRYFKILWWLSSVSFCDTKNHVLQPWIITLRSLRFSPTISVADKQRHGSLIHARQMSGDQFLELFRKGNNALIRSNSHL